MFKALRFVLGLIVALPLATSASQAAGGCGPYRYRGVFHQCWLAPTSARPVVRHIGRIVTSRPVYIRYRPDVRHLPAFYGAGRFVRHAAERRAYHETVYSYHHQNSHYSYHYSYHYSRNYSFHRHVHFGPRMVGRRGFVDQRRNLINEGRFLNRVAHRNIHRHF